jgi:YebC/PmpR family DNA-binding regulatory protein
MSGHNKWSSIKHKKGAADAKRGKLFSRLSKEITMAAREGGGDPDMNARLRSAVDSAKNENMPNDNIDRAIKKGTGELEGGALEELVYEGYGPGGVAILITCLSDNRNRTAASMRTYFTKHNSSLAGSGAVAWMFHRKAQFTITGEHADEDTLLDALLEAGADAETVEAEDDEATILAPPEAFAEVLDALKAADIPVASSGVTMIPENTTPVNEVGEARQLTRLIDALEDDEDVQEVFANFEFPDDIMEKLAGE